MQTIGYTRVSTEEQADSGLGLGAQQAAIVKACEQRDWTPVEILTDAGVSGSVTPANRQGLAEALTKLEAGTAGALVVAKLDRATRTLSDLCWLLDLSESQGWQFLALDMGIDTSTPMGRAMAQMAGVFSELERKMIGERTKAALAVKKAQGYRLGAPVLLDQTIRQRIATERADGRSLRAIAGDLNTENVPTARGGRWYASTIKAVLESVALDEAAAA